MIIGVVTILKRPVFDKLEDNDESDVALDLSLVSGAISGCIQLLKICAFTCCKRCVRFEILITLVLVELVLVTLTGLVMVFFKNS